MTTLKLSTTDLNTLNQCKKQWYYRSRHGLGLQKKDINMNFFLGRGIHHALDKWYSPDEEANLVDTFEQWCEEKKQEIIDDYKGLFPTQIQEINEQIDLGKTMLEGYIPWAKKHDSDYFEEVIDTEIAQDVEIPEADASLKLRFDGIVRDHLGRVFVLEYKTAKRFDTDHLDLDTQAIRYCWAAEQIYGLDVSGIIYTIFKKKAPGTPNETSTGKLSRSKINSTYPVIREAIVKHYGSEDEVPWDYYDEFLEHYKNQEENPFYHREKITKNDHEIQEIEERMRKEAHEIRTLTDNPERCYPQPHKMKCSWCSFQEPCKASIQGNDEAFLLEEMYESRYEEDDG